MVDDALNVTYEGLYRNTVEVFLSLMMKVCRPSERGRGKGGASQVPDSNGDPLFGLSRPKVFTLQSDSISPRVIALRLWYLTGNMSLWCLSH